MRKNIKVCLGVNCYSTLNQITYFIKFEGCFWHPKITSITLIVNKTANNNNQCNFSKYRFIHKDGLFICFKLKHIVCNVINIRLKKTQNFKKAKRKVGSETLIFQYLFVFLIAYSASYIDVGSESYYTFMPAEVCNPIKISNFF